MSSQPRSAAATSLGWNNQVALRLKDEVARWGRQQDVADRAKISRSALAAILNGSATPRLANLKAVCDVIGLDVDELFGAASGSCRESASRFLAIPEADLSYGMGGTFVDDISTSTVIRELPAEWVRSFTHAPAEQLFLCRGIGDSMMPTLLDSDLLLVDRSQTRLKQSDRIWVVMIGEIGMIKRLRVEPTGGLTLLSDNEMVPAMTVAVEEIVPIGRVVAVIRKM